MAKRALSPSVDRWIDTLAPKTPAERMQAGMARANKHASAEREFARQRGLKSTRPAGFVEVLLHSYEPSAIEATRKTMLGLRGAELREEGGRYFIPDGFAAWAAERQGYVARVIR